MDFKIPNISFPAKNTESLFYLISFLFIGLNSAFIYLGFYYFGLFSFVLAIAWFALFAFDKIYYFIVFVTPLSVSLSYYIDLPFDLSLPSEGLMIILTAILILKFISGSGIKKEYIQHPVSIAIILYLVWMSITSISSSMPFISFKFLLAKLWFIIPMYFFSLAIFQKEKNINTTIWLYILPLLFVIFYAINQHLGYGLFDKLAAHTVMTPFYKDHTSYGAILSMYWPVLFGFLFWPNISVIKKLFIFIVLLIFSLALLLSYTRAAWISLTAAIIFGLLVYLKVKIRYLIIIGLAIISVLFVYRFEISDRLSKNKQDSSAKIDDHIRSMSNIATDASNLERINRWNSALKMFVERPLAGWGPGTYVFQYANFQMARDKTIISTNFGEGGNAHSEYLSALIDSGIPGLISFLLIIVFVIRSALNSYNQTGNTRLKILVWSVLVGLVSYLVHGFLNNFLDTDKASVTFWAFIAIIVVIDIKLRKAN
ncbi:MAG: hypothetical protein B6I20_14440 [Bacteroidetes bacterium 4572_117]|nr:MAG: hypothetical protein B6I20_14440 [Bacteroidetes bacterium 4572_117]